MSFDPMALLTKPADSYEKPKAIPEGTYRAVCTKYSFGKWPDKGDGQGEVTFVELFFGMREPFPDVDADRLAGALGEATLDKKVLSLKKNITAEAMAYLGEILVDHLGAEAGIPTTEQLVQAVGKECAVTVVNNQGKGAKANEVYANIQGTAAL